MFTEIETEFPTAVRDENVSVIIINCKSLVSNFAIYLQYFRPTVVITTSKVPPSATRAALCTSDPWK